MISAPKPENERERLEALRAYELLDTKPEAVFEAITRLAAAVFDTPIAMISLIDEDRQWFKSQFGLGDTTSMGRDEAFCAHAILQTGIFEVADASVDARFADNPLVVGDPNIRFYAGIPLIEPGGAALGTLCVIDREPRELTPAQAENLELLGKVVVGIITMRIRRSEISAYRRSPSERRSAMRANLKRRSQLLAALTHSAADLRASLGKEPAAISTLLRLSASDWVTEQLNSTAHESAG